ncbi:MAG: transcriptional repressor [Cyanobacteria bacterium SID2]|nr:transcriptional repressor [Cyanobacteria bacterium SID2]MBP0005171.1 transcriptional repressor [Cyanobacteria bacterium SBC]
MKQEAVAVKPIRSLKDALDRCQALGMRLSRQRRLILELLWDVPDHLCARDIYDRLSRAGKEIGYTSVYQNLEALSSQGIIECIERSDGRLYGNISDSHSHVNCLDTQQIVDVFIELPPEVIAKVEEQTGIRITDYRIDFYGYQGETDAENGEEVADTQLSESLESETSISEVLSEEVSIAS